MRRLRRAPVAVLIAVVGALTVVAVAGLRSAVDVGVLRDAAARAADDPTGLVLALGGFGSAFALRARAWQLTLPGLTFGHSLAGIHLALGGNHVLPLRLGEPLRIISAVRREGADPAAATASTVLLRTADVLALLALGVLAGPAVMADLLGTGGVVAAAVLGVAMAAGWVALATGRAPVRSPGARVLALTTAAWALEAVLVWQVLRWFDVPLGPDATIVVLAAAVGAQLIAVAPGGLGTYEAAATAALVALGVPVGTAVSAALAIHALKTAYSLAAGAVALRLPAPALWGRLRLPRQLPAGATIRPEPTGVDPARRPVVLFLPAHEEGPRVGGVVRRAPATVLGHPVHVLVIDDGSTDHTVAAARSAGAEVVAHATNRGLGAAVRTGLEAAIAADAAAVAFCDADGEYDPAELEHLVGPVLDGSADYVVGSRFAGTIHHMRPHRRLGNLVLTAWVRWTVRQPVTDGQSGYRAFSPAAAASATIPHDYNYAQVLTVDLLARGFRYAEVPITYRFRTSGRSFVRLLRYLRRVVPTVWRQLNPRPT